MFFQRFIDSVSYLESLSFSFDDSFRDIYMSCWIEFAEKTDNLPVFAVVDGSRGSTTFRGGLKVVCVRALANVYEGWNIVGNVFDVDVRVGQRLQGESFFMSALELKCLRKALEKYEGVTVALYDGSLYPTLHSLLVKFTSHQVQAYKEYLNSFYDLYKFAIEHDIVLVGVTKDSFVNYLAARVLADRISLENPELGKRLERLRSMASLRDEISKSQLENRDVYLREVDRMSFSSDEETLDEFASKAGFTVPLVLAPQPLCLSEEVRAGTKKWTDAKIRERLLKAGPPFDHVVEALDRIYELPPVVMSYWRPYHGVGVYRLDVCGHFFGLNSKWNLTEADFFLEESVEKLKHIIVLLNSLSPEPFAVKPLLDVDDLVRFKVKVYRECYEPIIVDALKKAGLKPLLTKRDLREMAVRM